MKETKTIVYAALIGNACIAVMKGIAASITGSSAMLAETYHSISDTMNQIFLLIGLRMASKKADEQHPYGYGKAQFFWSFVVAVLLFGIAGVLSVIEGIHKIQNPEPLEDVFISYAVLAFALIFAGATLTIAGREMRRRTIEGGYRNMIEAMREIKDPTAATVVVEDSIEVGSLTLAAVAIYATQKTGNAKWDGLASFMIGITLMIMAIFLAKENMDLLIGEAIRARDKRAVIRAILELEEVEKVLDFRTMYLAPNELLVTCDVNFKDGLITDELEQIIDKIERKIRQELPIARRIYIEVEG
ncbi:MAG: cation diffusion facilitator family transporter [Candidatus Hodarchaeota archaeon]